MADSVKPCRTEVLPRIGRRCGAEGIHRHVKQVIDLIARGDCRDVCRAEAIDGSLQNDAADGGDGILESHGDADAAKALDVVATGAHFALLHLQNVEFACHIEKTKETRHRLGDDCGKGRTFHTHLKDEDGHKVKHDIQHRGGEQKIKRCFRVTHRTDDACEHIIEHRRGDAVKNNGDIAVGFIEKFLFGVHQKEDLLAKDAREKRYDGCDDDTEPDDVRHVSAQIFKVLLTEFLCHGNGKARADAVAKAEDEKVHGACGAHACERIYAEKTSDDEGVHHIIKLLKEQPAYQRNHKSEDQRQRLARCQIL